MEAFTEGESYGLRQRFSQSLESIGPPSFDGILVVGLVSGPVTAWADDIVLRWNQIAANTATATNPFNQASIGAIVQLALFEAVNAVTAEYEPYLHPPTVAPPGTSVEAAAITAAHKVLTT